MDATKIGIIGTILVVVIGGTVIYLEPTTEKDLCTLSGSSDLWQETEIKDLYYCQPEDVYKWCGKLSLSKKTCYLYKEVEVEKTKDVLTKEMFPVLLENENSLTWGRAVYEFNNILDTPIPKEKLKNLIPFGNDFVKGCSIKKEITEYTDKTIDTYSTKEICEDVFIANISSVKRVCHSESTINGSYIEKIKTIKFADFDYLDVGVNKIEVRCDLKNNFGKERNIEWMPRLELDGASFDRKEWAWWNTTWGIRRNITIVATNIGDLRTNFSLAYNMSFTVKCDGTDSKDFSCMRMTWYNVTDGTETEIPYWVENYVADSWAYVWFKPVLITPGSASNTIYVYGANSTPVANGNDVANAFSYWGDDFKTNTTSQYTYRVQTGGGSAQLLWNSGTGTVESNATASGYYSAWTPTNVMKGGMPNDTVIAVRVNATPLSAANANRAGIFILDLTDLRDGVVWRTLDQAPANFHLVNYVNNAQNQQVEDGSANANTWYTLQMKRTGTNYTIWNSTASGYTYDKALVGSYVITGSATGDVNASFTALTNQPTKETAGFDFFFVTKYNDTMPTFVLDPTTETILDATPPVWQDIAEGKPDPSVYSASPNYGFQVNCTDETSMGTPFFEHNTTGALANISMSGGTDGTYYANITSSPSAVINYSFICIDNTGNENRTSYNTFTVNPAPLEIYQWGQVVSYNNTHITYNISIIVLNNKTETISNIKVTPDTDYGVSYNISSLVNSQAYLNISVGSHIFARGVADAVYTIDAPSLVSNNYTGTGNMLQLINPIDPPSAAILKGGPSDSCTPPGSGNWEIDCGDECLLENDNIVINGDIVIYATTDPGTVTFYDCNVSMEKLKLNVSYSPFLLSCKFNRTCTGNCIWNETG